VSSRKQAAPFSAQNCFSFGEITTHVTRTALRDRVLSRRPFRNFFEFFRACFKIYVPQAVHCHSATGSIRTLLIGPSKVVSVAIAFGLDLSNQED
jgi:hypothetical protein